MKRFEVLLIEAESDSSQSLAEPLTRSGFGVSVVRNHGAAEERFDPQQFDAAVLHLGIRGPDSFTWEYDEGPSLPLVVAFHPQRRQNAFCLLKRGASGIIATPVEPRELEIRIRSAVQHFLEAEERAALRRSLSLAPRTTPMIFRSEPMQRVEQAIRRYAASPRLTYLLVGESGSGRESVARELHLRSPRREQPFVPVDCGRIHPYAMESVLFGDRGPGRADPDSHGHALYDLAQGGFLYLNEITELEPRVQRRLLAALKAPSVDSPVIVATTTHSLQRCVLEKGFSTLLHDTLIRTTIAVPPLRERREDIIPTVRRLLSTHRAEGSAPLQLDREAHSILRDHSWPGNLPELENLIRYLVLTVETGIIDGHTAAEGIAVASGPPGAWHVRLEDVKRYHTLRVLRQNKGNKSQTALTLGIALKTLYNWLNSYRVEGQF